MIKMKKLRGLLESRIAEAGDERLGRKRFIDDIHAQVGLLVEEKDFDGKPTGALIESTDDSGNRVIAKGSVKPEEFSLRELAEAIGGRDFVDSFHPSESPDRHALLEAGPGLDPTAFLNISTFSASVAGLIEAKIMESFNNVAYIGDQLFDTVPTNKNGEKMIGIGGFQPTDGTTERKPGKPHPRAEFGERWISTPELVEKALAVEVTQESVFYDLTGQILQTASGVGDILAYGKEDTQLKLFAGITNAYVYKGTAYDTYQTAAPWINDHANEAATYADIDEAMELFSNMTDPETGREIMIDKGSRVLVADESKESLWHFIRNTIETRATVSNTQMIASTPPSAASLPQPLSSVRLRNLLIASGLTADQAKGRSPRRRSSGWRLGRCA